MKMETMETEKEMEKEMKKVLVNPERLISREDQKKAHLHQGAKRD